MKTLLILTASLFLSFSATQADTKDPLTAISSGASRLKAHAFRLKPGQDFFNELTRWAKEHRIKAATIVSVVGSFKKINLRYANQPNGSAQEGFFEIVSIVGTFNESSAHLHASVSSTKGETFGGHLLPGNLVYTTAEVVVAELEDAEFTREKDPTYGYDELVVRSKLK